MSDAEKPALDLDALCDKLNDMGMKQVRMFAGVQYARAEKAERERDALMSDRDRWITESQKSRDRAMYLDVRLTNVTRERDEALAAIARVRSMHKPSLFNEGDVPFCLECHQNYPCNTNAALDDE